MEVFILVYLLVASIALQSSEACNRALGLESGAIRDYQIRVSSEMNDAHGSSKARLNGNSAWCSGADIYRFPYILINLQKPYNITGLAIQGSQRDARWVRNFVMSYNLAGNSNRDFHEYRENNKEKLFLGNTDATTVQFHKLKHPFIARKLHINPYQKGGYTLQDPACLRLEVYGCELPSTCITVGSRVFAKWSRYLQGLYRRAYVKSIGPRFVRVEIEDPVSYYPRYKQLSKLSASNLAMDVIPKPNELSVGTRVIADSAGGYDPGRITFKSGSRYFVQRDNGGTFTTAYNIRVLKTQTFCN